MARIDAHDIITCIRRFDANHPPVAVLAEIAHLSRPLLPWIPDDTAGAAGLGHDDPSPESGIVNDGGSGMAEIDAVGLSGNGDLAGLPLAGVGGDLVEILEAVKAFDRHIGNIRDLEVRV